MIRLDFGQLGYYKVYVEEDKRAAAYSRLLAKGISAAATDGYIRVPLGRKKKYAAVLSDLGVSFDGPFGAVGFLNRYKKRYGVMAALLISLAMYTVSSLFVWNVCVQGEDGVTEIAVEEQLDEAGLRVGRLWRAIQLDEVETDVLRLSENIGWININRRGSVAYVTVRSKTSSPSDQAPLGEYANVIAVRDCVIEEITVKRGIAAVKVGDSVKAGDVLISGIIPQELGGGFLRAEGEVVGRSSETVSVFVPREEELTEYGEERLEERKIKIFDFFINIFKNYRNSHKECAIIEETKEGMLLGRYRLPVTTVSVYSREIKNIRRRYTDTEIITVGNYRLEAALALQLCDAELLQVKTSSSLGEEGYEVSSLVTVLRSAGEQKRIFADREQ